MTPRRIPPTYLAALRREPRRCYSPEFPGSRRCPAHEETDNAAKPEPRIARPAGGVAVPARERNARPQPAWRDAGVARGHERRGRGLLAGRALPGGAGTARARPRRLPGGARAAGPGHAGGGGQPRRHPHLPRALRARPRPAGGQRRGPRGGARRHPPPHDGRPARARDRLPHGGPAARRARAVRRGRRAAGPHARPGAPGCARLADRPRARADRLGRRRGGRRGARGGPAGRGAVGRGRSTS